MLFIFFFFNDTATTEIYTLSLHDALPICSCTAKDRQVAPYPVADPSVRRVGPPKVLRRSEEHTSELQSRRDLVCRLLLEKKKKSRDLLLDIHHATLSQHSFPLSQGPALTA